MAKKLHRLTTYQSRFLFSAPKTVYKRTPCFDGGNFESERSEIDRKNNKRTMEIKKALYENRDDPFKWFTIFGVGFIFHFIYSLHSLFHHFEIKTVNYHVLLTPFEMIASVYKFDFSPSFSRLSLSGSLWFVLSVAYFHRTRRALHNHFTTVMMMIMKRAMVTSCCCLYIDKAGQIESKEATWNAKPAAHQIQIEK